MGDRRKCQTYTASPAEPGGLPVMLGGDDDAILAQTRLLIEQVLPRAEARWPRRPKVTTTDR